MVFQDSSLFPWLSRASRTSPRPIARGLSGAQVKERSTSSSNWVPRQIANAYPPSSPAHKQRVAIDRVLANDSDLV